MNDFERFNIARFYYVICIKLESMYSGIYELCSDETFYDSDIQRFLNDGELSSSELEIISLLANNVNKEEMIKRILGSKYTDGNYLRGFYNHFNEEEQLLIKKHL